MKVIDEGILQATPRSANEPADERPTVVKLFQSQSRRLARYLGRKLRNDDDARDASQEVFLKLWRQERSGQLREDATAYLFSAARTVAVDSERKRQTHAADRTVDLEEAQITEVADPRAASLDEIHHWRQGLAALVRRLEDLPVKTQKIFVLYHFENLNYGDIATRLGISERSVERHMAAAFAHCRKHLEAYL